MTDILSSFLFISNLFLVYNTITDIKRNKIDSRWNYMIYGATLMLLAYLQPTIWAIAVAIILVMVNGAVLKKRFADGDIEAFTWITIALICWASWRYLLFMLIFLSLNALAFLTMRFVGKTGKIAGYPLILSSWFIVSII